MKDFSVTTRDELADDYRVFYVTAWDYAADHLFGWFPKALNCHRDVFALLAHEGSRPKYLQERTRGERPPLIPFTEFLNDMGMTYSVIGDCYSYRAGQMPELLGVDRYKTIPVANLTRHPVSWLEFYVRWRASNMRMRAGAMDPLAWEWKVTCHAYFEYLGLLKYAKDDIAVWASYQGMFQLNNVLGDVTAVSRHLPIERVADDPEVFKDLVTYLSSGRVEFDQADLDRAFSTRHTLFRGESKVECDPDQLVESWPGWKVDAFRKIVSPQAIEAYKSFGYKFGALTTRVGAFVAIPDGLSRPVFVSTVPKAGTWLLREILERITGLTAREPEIGLGAPDYQNENLIEFPSGTFFSWHSILTSRSVSILRGCQAKNIFLIRNIYDVLLTMFVHMSRDVDAAIGRSVVGSQYFQSKTTEQKMTLMISGFTCPELTWEGVRPLIRQMDSFLDLVESGHALLLSYQQLTEHKREAIQRIMQALEYWLPDEQIEEIIVATDKDAMRERNKAIGLDLHITLPEHKLGRGAFLPYHEDMIDLAVMEVAPRLPERLAALGFGNILSPADDQSSDVPPADLTPQAAHHLRFDGSQILLVQKSSFPAKKLKSRKARLTGAPLVIGVDLRINDKGTLTTVLDISHDSTKGCVLQFQAGSDRQRGELCWFCAGLSLTSQIPVNQWIKVWLGYDATDNVAWMQVSDGPVMKGTASANAFPEPDIKLGIGHWLGGVGREFHGWIRNLEVQGVEFPPRVVGGLPARQQVENLESAWPESEDAKD